MKKYTTDAAGLFLLCALRKDSVTAKNLSVHTWTIESDQAFESWISEYRKNHGGTSPRETLKQTKREEFILTGMMELKERRFEIKENDLGFGLLDSDCDMVWYQPKPGNYYNSWDYHGLFEIDDDLNELERFILKNYFDKESKL